MNRKLTVVSWMAATTLASTAFAANGVFVVSYNEGKIYWVGTDGSGPHVVRDELTPRPAGAAFDSQGTGTLYWSQGVTSSGGTIYQSNPDGSEQSVAAAGFGWAASMALDTVHQKLYMAEWNECDSGDNVSSGLRRIDLSGSNSVMIDADADCGEGVAVDPVGGKVYWAKTNSTPTGGIYRANLDGSDRVLLIPVPGTQVGVHLELDVSGNAIYWSVSGFMGQPKEIRRSNLSDGGQTETLITFASPNASIYIAGLAVDPDAGFIYWIQNSGTNQVLRRAHLDGSNNLPMFGVPASTHLTGIALDKRTPFCTRTSMYADITNLQGSVEFGDVSVVVDAFRGQFLIDPTLCDLYPCDLGGRRCMGDGLIDFRDVSQVVDAFRNVYTNCPE